MKESLVTELLQKVENTLFKVLRNGFKTQTDNNIKGSSLGKSNSFSRSHGGPLWVVLAHLISFVL